MHTTTSAISLRSTILPAVRSAFGADTSFLYSPGGAPIARHSAAPRGAPSQTGHSRSRRAAVRFDKRRSSPGTDTGRSENRSAARPALARCAILRVTCRTWHCHCSGELAHGDANFAVRICHRCHLKSRRGRDPKKILIVRDDLRPCGVYCQLRPTSGRSTKLSVGTLRAIFQCATEP